MDRINDQPDLSENCHGFNQVYDNNPTGFSEERWNSGYYSGGGADDADGLCGKQ
jgi:hypothetical protein